MVMISSGSDCSVITSVCGTVVSGSAIIVVGSGIVYCVVLCVAGAVEAVCVEGVVCAAVERAVVHSVMVCAGLFIMENGSRTSAYVKQTPTVPAINRLMILVLIWVTSCVLTISYIPFLI